MTDHESQQHLLEVEIDDDPRSRAEHRAYLLEKSLKEILGPAYTPPPKPSTPNTTVMVIESLDSGDIELDSRD